MPVKSRWALNPRKWFGMRLKNGHRQEADINLMIRPPPTATTTRTIPSISTIARGSSGKNKIRVTQISTPNDVQTNNTTVTQLRLPAFSIRRERTSTTIHQQKTFHPTHTEPTIRKNSRIEQDLSIHTTRWNIPTIPPSISENFQQNSPVKQLDTSVLDMSHRCLVNYPRQSTDAIEECSLPSRSSSVSSMADENDHSSSSGIFTDERQRTGSKDNLSVLEALSIESISDSQTLYNQSHTRPIIHHYRRPMSVFESINDKPEQRQTSLIRSHRSHSAEGILKDNPMNSASKSRQSSAAIAKKIEKRFPSARSPLETLEKPGFIRITNDTYRLSTNELSCPRKNSINSFVPYSNYDDPLRSANDEECYATLPRTSSTEQLNNNNLRLMVNECIRPMFTSLGKNHSTKTHHRSKRSQAQTELNIENITDKLLSSMDYSIYTRYQRCN